MSCLPQIRATPNAGYTPMQPKSLQIFALPTHSPGLTFKLSQTTATTIIASKVRKTLRKHISGMRSASRRPACTRSSLVGPVRLLLTLTTATLTAEKTFIGGDTYGGGDSFYAVIVDSTGQFVPGLPTFRPTTELISETKYIGCCYDTHTCVHVFSSPPSARCRAKCVAGMCVPASASTQGAPVRMMI